MFKFNLSISLPTCLGDGDSVSVDSNDALYGGDPKFIAEVNSISSTLLDEILSHLKMLSAPNVSDMAVTSSYPDQNTCICNLQCSLLS